MSIQNMKTQKDSYVRELLMIERLSLSFWHLMWRVFTIYHGCEDVDRLREWPVRCSKLKVIRIGVEGAEENFVQLEVC